MIAALEVRGSYLDVGCGTDQMLAFARGLGFCPVVGVDHASAGADAVAQVHALPFRDKSFDVVVMLDVIEHLVRGDDELACRELGRVARKLIVVSANNRPSVWLGKDLHINKRDYGEWDTNFKKWLPGSVRRMDRGFSSPIWQAFL